MKGRQPLKLAHVLRSRGITEAELAKRVGIMPGIMSRIVRGEQFAFPKWRRAIARELDWPCKRIRELFE